MRRKKPPLRRMPPTIVCVTACPAGSPIPPWQREYLEKRDVSSASIVVEKQGANGIEGGASPRSSCRRQARIFAAEVAIKSASVFQDPPPFPCRRGTLLRHAEARSLSVRWRSYPVASLRTSTRTRKSALNPNSSRRCSASISFAVPLIVASARCWP